jgi:hypothetical protein
MMMNGMTDEPMGAPGGDGADIVEAFRGGAARLTPEEQQILKDAIDPVVAAALTKMFGPAFGQFLEPFLADDAGMEPGSSPIGRSGEMADGRPPRGPSEMPPGALPAAPRPPATSGRPFPPQPRRPVSGLGGAGTMRR